jgi:hypothetical protein
MTQKLLALIVLLGLLGASLFGLHQVFAKVSVAVGDGFGTGVLIFAHVTAAALLTAQYLDQRDPR